MALYPAMIGKKFSSLNFNDTYFVILCILSYVISCKSNVLITDFTI